MKRGGCQKSRMAMLYAELAFLSKNQSLNVPYEGGILNDIAIHTDTSSFEIVYREIFFLQKEIEIIIFNRIFFVLKNF